MYSRLQTSIRAPATATSIIIQQPTGVPLVTIPFAANAYWPCLDDILLYIQNAISAIPPPGPWSVVVRDVLRSVYITTTGGNFDWSWNTATWLRDLCGYPGNVVNQASPWLAPVEHVGGFYPQDAMQSGCETASLSLSVHTSAVRTLAGYQAAANVANARSLRRTLELNVQRDAAIGSFDELTRYWAFLDLAADGRQFRVWPDGQFLGTYVDCALAVEGRISLRRRYPRQMTYFSASWPVEAQS
jgi:hypothetical protein